MAAIGYYGKIINKVAKLKPSNNNNKTTIIGDNYCIANFQGDIYVDATDSSMMMGDIPFKVCNNHRCTIVT